MWNRSPTADVLTNPEKPLSELEKLPLMRFKGWRCLDVVSGLLSMVPQVLLAWLNSYKATY